MSWRNFKRLEQVIHASVDVLGLQQYPRHVHMEVFVILGKFQRASVVFKRLFQHLVLAQADAELVEKVLVFGLKSAVQFYKTFKDVLRPVGIATLKVGKANAKVGAYVVIINLEGAGILEFSRKRLALFPTIIALFNGALHFLHLGVDRIEVKLRFGRKFGEEFVHGDFALGAAWHVVGVERLALNDFAVLLNEPEAFLYCFAGRGACAYPADFLRGEHAAHIGFMPRRMARTRRG